MMTGLFGTCWRMFWFRGGIDLYHRIGDEDFLSLKFDDLSVFVHYSRLPGLLLMGTFKSRLIDVLHRLS
jgi:hypothetical protein